MLRNNSIIAWINATMLSRHNVPWADYRTTAANRKMNLPWDGVGSCFNPAYNTAHGRFYPTWQLQNCKSNSEVDLKFEIVMMT